MGDLLALWERELTPLHLIVFAVAGFLLFSWMGRKREH